MPSRVAYVTAAAAVAAGALAAATFLMQRAKGATDDSLSATPEASSSAPAAAASSSSVASASSGQQVVGVVSSASSKVLLTGGYLILESAFPGLVLALSARFHTAIVPLDAAQANQLSLAASTESTVSLLVYAPQRSGTPARYTLSWDADNGTFALAKAQEQETNKFVELTILYTLLYLSQTISLPTLVSRLAHGLVIDLEGDFPFYSAEAPISVGGVPPVVPDGSKTGLGSSAALVTSMVAALFAHFGVEATAAAHNLAQFVHCAAQGKVGSGFDVSTAFYGSQVYQRFGREAIQDLVEAAAAKAGDSPATCIRGDELVRRMAPGAQWTNSVQSFSLPPGLSVILGDVAGGASTPVMVKKVLAWRENKAESDPIWTSLAKANATVGAIFNQLSEIAAANPADYHATRTKLARAAACKWDLLDSTPAGVLFARLAREFYAVRHFLRALGTAADVSIEPAQQSALLDSTILQAGVLLAGVPGAGGDDAIFAVLMDGEVEPSVEGAWTEHRFPNEPERRVRRLPVSEAKERIVGKVFTADLARWTQA